MPRIFAYTLALILSTSFALQANEVPLRLSPNTASPVIQLIQKSDPIAKRAVTITNAGLAQRGWMQSSTRVELEGYLSTANLSKNFEIEINTRVYAQNTLSGTALTRIEAGDPIELLEVQDTWAHIRIKKMMPVYFQVDTPRAPLPVYIPPFQSAAQQRSTQNTRFDPQQRVGTIRPNQLPPENTIWSAAPNVAQRKPPTPYLIPRDAADPVPTVTRPARSQPQRPRAVSQQNIQADGLIYHLNGTLTRSISDEAPRYSLRLEDAIGGLIAYVDLTEMYIEDIQSYVDQFVHIYGEVKPLDSNSDLSVVIARTIRIH